MNKKKNRNNKQQKKIIPKILRAVNINEMKAHKVKAAIYIIIRVVILAIMVFSIVRGQWENTMTCVMSLGLLMIPTFIEHKMNIDLPNVMEVIMIIFVFAANVMGELGAFYEAIPIWDTILHALNGFICAGVGFGLIDILNRNEKIKMNLSPMFVCLFSFCFSMTAGTVWEFFEFGVDMLLGRDMQKDTIINSINSVLLSGGTNDVTRIKEINETVINGKSLGINGYLDIGLIDTMKDLLVNFVGAVIFNFVGYFYLKDRGKSVNFITNFIPRRINLKESKDN